jgi:hypothetical protein
MFHRRWWDFRFLCGPTFYGDMSDQNCPLGDLDHEIWQGLIPPLIDVHGILTQSLTHTVDVLSAPGVEVSCALSLEHQGSPVTLASSSPDAFRLTSAQYRFDGSPYYEAARTQLTASAANSFGLHGGELDPPVSDLLFRSELIVSGVEVVLAVPIPPISQTRGVLSLYSSSHRPFSPAARRFLERVAGSTVSILKPAVETAEQTGSLDDLQGALLSRAVIDRAVGTIMGHQGCSQEHAHTLLLRAARQSNKPILEIAHTILTNIADS